MKFNKFEIYKSFPLLDAKPVLIPEIGEVLFGSDINTEWNEKLYSASGLDLTEGTGDLVLTDKTLIDDLKESGYYLLFELTDDVCDNNALWDNDLTLDDFVFLGWSIRSHEDHASTDGIFPLLYDEHETDVLKQIDVLSADAINQWGLIKDESTCQMYLDKNNNEVKHLLVNDDGSETELETNWRAYAIYCDKYTYEKLNVR